MKALILSFFAVILGYSLIFNEKKATEQVIKDSNSVYLESPSSTTMQGLDSTDVQKPEQWLSRTTGKGWFVSL